MIGWNDLRIFIGYKHDINFMFINLYNIMIVFKINSYS